MFLLLSAPEQVFDMSIVAEAGTGSSPLRLGRTRVECVYDVGPAKSEEIKNQIDCTFRFRSSICATSLR